MSAAMAFPAGGLYTGGARLFVAPVDRTEMTPAAFDPAQLGRFALSAPPSGWIDGGTITNFVRNPGTAANAVRSGSPATVKLQSRSILEEEVHFTFSSWSRIAMVLSSGAQTMNLLRTIDSALPNASGGIAMMAEPLLLGSTATVLQVPPETSIQAGDVVAVDVDYVSTMTGFLGSGAAGTYLAASANMPDLHYTRRVTGNVARVLTVSAGAITLASPLLAGAPSASMKVAVVEGFVDRTGGAFFPEWSALIVFDGVQGDRLLLHYPRLQPVGASPAEVSEAMAPGVDRWRPCAQLRALPITDVTDGTSAICFRSYMPAPMRLV